MRDQWRADDDSREPRDRQTHDRARHRSRTPPRSRRTDHHEAALKTKGRAPPDSPVRPHRADRERSRSPRRTAGKRRLESPHRRRHEDTSKSARDHSEERFSKRERPRERHRSTSKSKPLRNATPERRSRHSEHERQRSPSFGHIDRGVDRDRGERRRDRAYSPYSPRREHYAPSREHTHLERPARDSYIPSASRRGRSRSPVAIDQYRPDLSRRTSRSPSRRRYRREEDHKRARHSREDSRRRESDRTLSPGKVSKSSKRSEKQKQRTLKHLQTKVKTKKELAESPSPTGTEREDKAMQSTRPIQSILDDHPRQPSPPRPIPSFDDSHGIGDSHMREAYPMHGMKATDMHGSHRPYHTHLDTRQQYATSPQYMTPTSSHHGSPHSASPYSQGRGGWVGQPQYMGQPYVLGPSYRTNQANGLGHKWVDMLHLFDKTAILSQTGSTIPTHSKPTMEFHTLSNKCKLATKVHRTEVAIPA